HLKTWPEWLPIPSEYQVDVDDVCGMLRESVEKGLEMLKLIMVSIKLYYSKYPLARGLVWRVLTDNIKQALAKLSPLDYQFLAGYV
ncbi:MAG: hypothetical protein AB4426_12400, partial [Xenococcaceae cyanobacterium]